ncbi:hypothetical protein ONA92_27170 [Mycobacteroides salmoniphilum]|uniref:hypothetical protein n=1 Tax=Mycobacteroides salmoniphilum TaxID=404941 RepID=UPI0035685C30
MTPPAAEDAPTRVPQRIRPKPDELLAMKFDGTTAGAQAIGRWLGRHMAVLHGLLFTVLDDGGRQSLQPHGGTGSWVVKHRDGAITSEWDEWIRIHYQPAPEPSEEARALTNQVVYRWRRHNEGRFTIDSPAELQSYLTDIITARQAR